nr:uncharacterized protein LOC100201455 isoform X2 [Hydra vulgaris]
MLAFSSSVKLSSWINKNCSASVVTQKIISLNRALFVVCSRLDKKKFNCSWPSNIDLLNSRDVKFLKRCSSTQHIHFKKVEKSPSMSTYSSLPNVCQDNPSELKSGDCQTQSELIIRNPNVSCSNRSGIPSLQVNGEELFYDETLDEVDEGQMQCIMQYQKSRSLIVIKSMSVQTIIPQYIPAFYIEISVIPSHENQVWCSRVYPSKDGIIDITINEMFEIQANDEDIKQRSLIISVNPIIGNFKLYAETDLAYLDTPNAQEIYLGGFLKGVYTLSC